MSEEITRRDFLKAAGLGSAAAVLLSSCGKVDFDKLYPGLGQFLNERKLPGLKTTCGECPAGCGLLVTTNRGQVVSFEGNPSHPVNRGILCNRSQLALEKLNHPARLRGPSRQNGRGSNNLVSINWEEGIRVVEKALKKFIPGEIAFLLGLFPDHLNDLVRLLSGAMGGFNVLRYSLESELGSDVTLMDATQSLFGISRLPYFDVGRTQLVFSFGLDFQEPWISPAGLEKSLANGAYFVHFGSRLPRMLEHIGEWMPVRPGSEGILAAALSSLVSELQGSDRFQALTQLDLEDTALLTGVSANKMKRLARLFFEIPGKVAIPGRACMDSSNGLENARAILGLNTAARNLGKRGGIFITPDSPLYPELSHRPGTIAELAALVKRINCGQIKALLIHGVDPMVEAPRWVGFKEALQNLELVISFSPYFNETSQLADYLLPDHTPLESWGYQRAVNSERLAVSGLRPVIPPRYNTRPTANVLLEAVSDGFASTLPYKNEEEFLQKSVAELLGKRGAAQVIEPEESWKGWLEEGGWWEKTSWLAPPVMLAENSQPKGALPENFKQGEVNSFNLILLPGDYAMGKGKVLGQVNAKPIGRQNREKGATWIDMHPEAAVRLGLRSGSRVRITSLAGEITAVVDFNSAIHPDTVVIGWDAWGVGRGWNVQIGGANPLDLLGNEQNQSGVLAYSGMKVSLVRA